ncbi:MAG: MG2 domain-containing protein, partial [Flavobacterium sp.]
MKLFRGLLLLCAVMLISLSCQKKVSLEEFNSDFSLYQEYIHSFSSGQISAYSDIRVLLAFEKSDWEEKKELDPSLFSVEPKVKGKIVSLQNNVIAFIPDEPLSQNTEYRLTLKLNSLIDVPKELSEFRFSVTTFEQDFSVQPSDLQSYSKDYQYLNAQLQTVDKMHPESAQKLLQASQGGKSLKIKFANAKEPSTVFNFVVDSIKREVEDNKITLQWNGDFLKIKQKGSLEFEILGKNNFKVIAMDVADENNQSLHINFSDPIKKGQDLNGLVAVENTTSPRFSIDGNVLKVFFKESIKGEVLVEVFQGIQSEDGYKMKETYAQKVAFQQLKPGIRFLKNGTILPGSENLKINFEAANLKAVDVKVFKIYQNNVLQFLQNNALNGKRNLRQVASPVATRTINLQEKKLSNYSRWNAFALDVAKVIQPEPGAIYRVELSFKKSYSLYECIGGTTDPEESNEDADEVRSNEDYYDYYWYDDYSWQDQQDPCSQRFFNRGPIGMNVLATDLGVIAKRGEAGEYLFAVNNIVSTQPVGGANVTLYDFQKQKLASASTSSEGLVSLKSDRYAYFAIVTKDNQTTYVKMDEGQSLSVSNFDVSGEKLQKGLKGFIYGERGVWRPGDTLFIGFMLNDAAATLDKNHPIQFKLNDPNGKLTYQSTQTYKELNHYKFVVPTKDADLTGNWEAIISVGGAKFYKSIKIETIKPNRLKIKNPLGDQLLSSQKSHEAILEVQWLHGAIAKDLKLEMQAKFLPQNTTFKGFDNYQFDDPTRSFQTEEVNLFSGKTDENGKA